MKGVRDQVVPIRAAIRFGREPYVSSEFGSLVSDSLKSLA